jgi:amino acid permease
MMYDTTVQFCEEEESMGFDEHDTRPTKGMRGGMKHSYRVSFVGEHGLTTFTGALAILSTIIGGGIVSIPYSFVSFGIPFGILANLIACLVVMVSCDLYLAAKDIVPDNPTSFYEIGYMTMGRSSIFMVGLAQFINSFGLMLVYYIVFGDTTA